MSAPRPPVAEALRAALDVEGISQATLARRTGMTAKHINQLLQGDVPLSVTVALKMEDSMPSVAAEDLMVAQARTQVRDARRSTNAPN